MTIPPIQPTVTAARQSLSKDASRASADYDTYLQLLVTELKNQDPTKPVDPTQTITQLATFSSLEQAVKTNDLLSTLSQQATLSQGAGLIGRTITSADRSITGTVRSVTLGDTGVTVNLTDGASTRIAPGVSIS